MDKVQNITRRAAVIGALVSTAALGVPVAAAVIVGNPEGASERIAALYAQWLAVRNETWDGFTEQQCEARHAVYVRLQAECALLEPVTARDLAMQLVVETDHNWSDWRPGFYNKVGRIARKGSRS